MFAPPFSVLPYAPIRCNFISKKIQIKTVVLKTIIRIKKVLIQKCGVSTIITDGNKMKNLYFICTLAYLLVSTSSSAQYTKLIDFEGTINGSAPKGSLITDGTFLYGMTAVGGINDSGRIFKIMPNGTGYEKLLDFIGTTNGSQPYGSLVSDGIFLYGMTSGGGNNGAGTIFKIMPDGSGYLKLLDFAGTSNGSNPEGSLISDGTFLYGMTTYGGTNNLGTIFKIKSDGTGYIKLLEFSGASNGSYPFGSLVSDGIFFYGMTASGGANDFGTIFKIMPDGTGYVNLLDFAGGTNGNVPYGSLISDGTFLYGMTYQGGTSGMGTIFKIMPNGNGFTKLLDFAGATNGKGPYGSLVSDGNFLYGMTQQGGTGNIGTIFKIMPDGNGYEKLLDFAVGNGSSPYGALLYNNNNLYGMTLNGGTNNIGTVFKYGLTLGINEFSVSSNQFLVYPNPANNTIIIKSNENNSITNIELIDISGRVVQSIKSNFENEVSLDVSHLSAGNYIVRLQSAEESAIKKFIKI